MKGSANESQGDSGDEDEGEEELEGERKGRFEVLEELNEEDSPFS